MPLDKDKLCREGNQSETIPWTGDHKNLSDKLQKIRHCYLLMGNFLPLLKIQVEVVRKISKDPWGSLSVERESNLSMWLWHSLTSLSNHESSWPFVFLSAKYLLPFYTHGKFLTLWAWWDSPFLLVQKVKLHCPCFYSLHCTEHTEFSSGSRKYLLWNLFVDLMREEKNPFGEKVAP